MVEVLVAIAVFSVFTLFLTSAIIYSLRYINQVEAEISYQQAVRYSIETIVEELRQAIPNPDPGTAGNDPTGYKRISPSVGPTGVLYPNANSDNGTYLLFTEPNPDTYDPSESGFSKTSPEYYQQVKYYVQDNVLYRSQKRFDETGAVSSEETQPIVSVTPGSLSLQVQYESATSFTVKVSASNDADTGERSIEYSASVDVDLLVE